MVGKVFNILYILNLLVYFNCDYMKGKLNSSRISHNYFSFVKINTSRREIVVVTVLQMV